MSSTGRRLIESGVLCVAVVDAIPYGVFVLDRSGVIVDVNQAAASLLGGSMSSAIGVSWGKLFPDVALRPHDSASDAKGAFGPQEENLMLKPDGSQIPVQVTAFEASDDDEQHVVALVRDLRPNRLAEKRIMARERLAAIGETVTALAHESRNSLQRMQACLTLIRLRGNAEIHELADDMQDAQDHLQDLYEEVRRYAAPMEINREIVDIRKLCKTVWRQLRLKWKPRGLKLAIIEATGSDLEVNGDPVRLSQVIRNLFENAIDASPEGGQVEVEFSSAEIDGEGALKFIVKDNGPGIPESDRRYVFDLMFTTKQQGTGMGLAIAKRIVLAHDGFIQVEPDSSTGAGISVALPRT